MGEVMPKLPSGPSLLKTVGYVPSATAVAHFTFTVVVPPASSGSVTVRATQPGGKVCPTVTVDAVAGINAAADDERAVLEFKMSRLSAIVAIAGLCQHRCRCQSKRGEYERSLHECGPPGPGQTIAAGYRGIGYAIVKI